MLPRVAGAINRSAQEAYRYLNESIEQWPAQEELAAWLREAGLKRVAYRNLTFGIVALHRGTVPEDPVTPSTASAKKPAVKKPAAAKKAPAPKKAGSAKKPGTATSASSAPAKARPQSTDGASDRA